jgi:hypothetical protein
MTTPDPSATERPTGSDGATPTATGAPGTPVRPEVVERGIPVDGATGPGAGEPDSPDGDGSESIEQPAKLLRIGSMVKQLLEEVRRAPLDEAGRARLREIYEQSIRELSEGMSPDLVAELERVSIPFDDAVPSEDELRIAQAQLVGWLEGLFHGIQATLVAQQMAARAQLAEMRQPSLPTAGEQFAARPGTYL